MEKSAINDCLDAEKIKKYIGSDLSERVEIKVLDKTTSTNDVVKKHADSGAVEGFTVIAGEQTHGKGRRGRTFFSPGDTGLYMSVLLKPVIPPEDAVLITTAAAVSVVKAFEKLGVCGAGIKWVNDIFLNGKKVCGILTEACFGKDVGKLDYAVLGVGVNMYEPEGGFPADISDIAGAVFSERKTDLRNMFAAYFIDAFFGYYKNLQSRQHCREYADRCFVLGKCINVITPNGVKGARALSLDENCSLVVRYDTGETAVLNSGEISVRVAQAGYNTR